MAHDSPPAGRTLHVSRTDGAESDDVEKWTDERLNDEMSVLLTTLTDALANTDQTAPWKRLLIVVEEFVRRRTPPEPRESS